MQENNPNLDIIEKRIVELEESLKQERFIVRRALLMIVKYIEKKDNLKQSE